MIRGMLDCLDNTEPAVVNELGRILEKHPELDDKMIVYCNTPGQKAES